MAAEVAYALCWRYWRDKIDWVVKKWEGLERVEVRCAAAAGEEHGVLLEGGEWRWPGEKEEIISFEGGEWRCPGKEGEEWRGLLEEGKAGRRLLERAREGVKGELGRLVEEVGWKVVRKALMNGRVEWRGGSGVVYM